MHAAHLTKLNAGTLIMHLEFVDTFADKRYKPDSVGDKFVVEHRRVFAYLHQVDSHRWNFADDYAAKGIRHRQVRVV